MAFSQIQQIRGERSVSEVKACRNASSRGRPPRAFHALRAGAALVCLLAGARTVTAQAYTVTALGTLGGGTAFPHGINNAGQVVGESALPGDSITHAFLWENGVMRDLGALGGVLSMAISINDAGQVVGLSSIEATGADLPGQLHPFLYDGTGMHDLGTLGDGDGAAFDINAAGQVVGYSGGHSFLYGPSGLHDLPNTLGGPAIWASGINDLGQIVGTSTGTDFLYAAHAVLYDRGVMHDLGALLSYGRSAARRINAAGQVTGNADAPVPVVTQPPSLYTTDAFLYDHGKMHDLGTLGGEFSVALGMNAAGQVVGHSLPATGELLHAFLYSDGVMNDLNSLIPTNSSWSWYSAADINDHGQIVAFGGGRAFLLTPKTPLSPSGAPSPP